MNLFSEKYFNRGYVIVCCLVFIVVCLRAFFIPFTHDEASTFFFYIQSDNYLPYRAHLYTNNHVLNSALANICYHVAGSHPFVLRIPNVLAFIALCVGVFRFCRHLEHISSKVMLTCFFILTFNLLDFFELCRGYGLSIAFMLLALSHLPDYFRDKNFKHLFYFSVFWQLALSANLTLVTPTLYLFVFGVIFQSRNKLVFEKKNIALQLLNLYLLAFWVKFSFFYKIKGVLDSGIGDEYWTVTFKSLLLLVFGVDAAWIQVLLVALFSLLVIFSSIHFFTRPVNAALVFDQRFFFIAMLITLIISLFFQKQLLNINYPQDRTGLFLYVFFVLALVVFFDSIPTFISSAASLLLLLSSLVYFVLSFSLQSFTHYFYHVLPNEFYSILETDYKKRGQFFTIGGNSEREMNYAFSNYRAGGLLNAMNDNKEMHMNTDYNIALMAEKPFFRFFYDEMPMMLNGTVCC